MSASDPGFFDSFGRAVAVDGQVAAVGAFWDDEAGLDAGAAYVFRRDGDA